MSSGGCWGLEVGVWVGKVLLVTLLLLCPSPFRVAPSPPTSVIGPPYAITGIEPNIGPVTGGTTLTVSGLGFDEGQSVTVRFTLGKKFVDATGTCTSATTLTVVSPGFEHLGPGKVVVRLAFRGQQPTITWEEFTFFDVTEPSNCLAFGPGVLNGAAPGVPVEFYIQSRDRNDHERTSGMDEWEIVVQQVDEEGAAGAASGSSAPAAQAPQGSPEKRAPPPAPITVPVHVVDLNNGKYHVTYTAPEARTYTVDIKFLGTWGATAGRIRKAPIKVCVGLWACVERGRGSEVGHWVDRPCLCGLWFTVVGF